MMIIGDIFIGRLIDGMFVWVFCLLKSDRKFWDVGIDSYECIKK